MRYFPTEPFTMQEFIEANKLPVHSKDIPAVRVLSQWLRDRGYRRYRSQGRVLWAKGDRLAKLKETLDG